MEQIKDILRLVRWGNLLFLGALVWLMEKWVAVPVLRQAAYTEILPWYIVVLLTIAVVFVAAGGYVINDYFDVKIDRINRPDSVIVTRTISKPAAMRLSVILSAIGVISGIVAAVLLKSMTIGIIMIIVPGLLWFYSSSYKRLLIIGNVTIALLAATTPLLVAFANEAQMKILHAATPGVLPFTPVHSLYAWLGGFALFAFLLTWAREIVKDLQDQMGDRELECHTMPVVWGEKWTKGFVTGLIVVTIAIIGHLWYHILPFPAIWNCLSTRYIALGIVIPLLGALWLLWSSKISSDYKTCQLVLKFTMFLGMLYSICIVRGL